MLASSFWKCSVFIGAFCDGASCSEQYFWRIRQYYEWRRGAGLFCCPLLLAGVGSLQGAAGVDWLEQIHCGMWSVLSPCRGWERLTGLRNSGSGVSAGNRQEGPTLGERGRLVWVFFVIIKMLNPRNPSACKYYRSDPQLMCSGKFIICAL